jgi:hypothetical protein
MVFGFRWIRMMGQERRRNRLPKPNMKNREKRFWDGDIIIYDVMETETLNRKTLS